MSLSAEEILASKRLIVEEVATPDWGGSVFVKMMPGFERDAWELFCAEIKAKNNGHVPNFRAVLAVGTVCNSEGDLLFSFDQVESLGQTSSRDLDRVFDVALRLNKLSSKDVEQLEKNS